MQICKITKLCFSILFYHSFVISNDYIKCQTFGTSFGLCGSLQGLEQSISSLPCWLRISELQSLLTHWENTAVHVTSECPSQKDAFLTLTVLIGIQCYTIKANNYQDCWQEIDHITFHKANLLAVNVYSEITLIHGFYIDFLSIKWQGMHILDLGYRLIWKSTY